MPDSFTKYELTDEGVVNPPSIARFERDLTDAHASGDQSQIDAIMDEYHDAREDLARRHNQRVDERLDEDRRLLAEADTRRQDETRAREDAAAAQAQREEADRLRAANASGDADAPPAPDAGNAPPAAPQRGGGGNQ